ncbi:uncharacterized protein LOC122507509 [Leptopilina heterotoma]|uniref:uncharacterized protein LOC122507509 n=1 Tax=Leptopilina heterotoma TaxID=63436 RepID=UPI001CA9E1DB|nr:uncharacterized protein LOC122507509 [Leptopilina heterotoma]
MGDIQHRALSRDEHFKCYQDLTGAALASISTTLNKILEDSKTPLSREEILENLSSSVKLLSELFHLLTQARKVFLVGYGKGIHGPQTEIETSLKINFKLEKLHFKKRSDEEELQPESDIENIQLQRHTDRLSFTQQGPSEEALHAVAAAEEQTLNQDKESHSSPVSRAYPGIRSFISQSFKEKDLGEDTIEILFESLAESSKKQYNTSLKYWWNFCEETKQDPYLANDNTIPKCLTKKFSEGASYGTLNTLRSAIALINNYQITESKLINRFFKGIFRIRPTLPRYTSTWDVDPVVKLIEEWSPNSQIDLKNLDAADKKEDLYIKLSDVDSDQNVNEDKLKRSRHDRCVKRRSDDEENLNNNSEKKKSKPLSVLSNVLWTPKVSCISLPGTVFKSAALTSTNSGENVAPLQGNNLNPKENDTDLEVSTGELRENSRKDEYVDQELNSSETVTPTAVKDTTKLSDSVKKDNKKASRNKQDNTSTNQVAIPSTSQSTNRNVGGHKTLYEVYQKVVSIETVVKSFFKGEQKSGPSFDTEKDLKMFPAKSMKEVFKISKKLKEKEEFYEQVRDAAVRTGYSQSINMTINNILNDLLTFEAGMSFTFEGRSGKKPAFKKLKLRNIVIDSMINLKPSVSKAEIDTGIKKWLQSCKKNRDRQIEKMDKEKQQENEETISISGDDNGDSSTDTEGSEKENE